MGAGLGECWEERWEDPREQGQKEGVHHPGRGLQGSLGQGSCSGSHSWSPRSLGPAPNHWTANGSPQFQPHLCLQPWLTARSAQGWANLTHVLPGHVLQTASQAVSADTGQAGQCCQCCPQSTLHSPQSPWEQPHWAGCNSAVSCLPSVGHKTLEEHSPPLLPG